MSGEALLATPARPLCELSHKPPKKGPPEVASLFAQITRYLTSNRRLRFIRGRHFLDLGLIAAVTARTDACPTPSGHKVRRIAADIRNGSLAPF